MAFRKPLFNGCVILCPLHALVALPSQKKRMRNFESGAQIYQYPVWVFTRLEADYDSYLPFAIAEGSQDVVMSLSARHEDEHSTFCVARHSQQIAV